MTVAHDIRPADEGDLPALVDIYNHYVRRSPVTFDVEPQSLEQRRAWFQQFAAKGPHRLLVAARDAAILGYVGSHRFREKPAYATSVETTIYLRPEATRQGIGAALYERLFAALRSEDLHRAYAGVTLPNDASERLHRRVGFLPIGVYREVGRKFGRYWDVRWFEKAL
ncbi:MAG: N-acetyltransferase [Proteobacteria bacterium]|nr:N-acetyltransferase [Pseudomonadota bacterium]